MKKHVWLTVLLALALLLGSVMTANAEIIPASGEGQIGLQAVVLCESLTLRESPSAGAAAVKALPFGAVIIVMKQEDGWAECVLSDSEDALSGWVRAEYLVLDPAWYKTSAATPVYAWNEETAPKIALLDADTLLPILKDDGDWLIVSLRGAVGWIHK